MRTFTKNITLPRKSYTFFLHTKSIPKLQGQQLTKLLFRNFRDKNILACNNSQRLSHNNFMPILPREHMHKSIFLMNWHIILSRTNSQFFSNNSNIPYSPGQYLYRTFLTYITGHYYIGSCQISLILAQNHIRTLPKKHKKFLRERSYTI